jgi:PadR family transcriptional regulator AphA
MPNKPAATRQSRSRYVILGILSIRPCSGYDIRKAISQSTSFFWTESPGQLYPALEAMVKSGEVKRVEVPDSGRGRVEYRITAAGRRAFAAWMKLPYQPTVERNELLLKLFFGRLAEPAVTRGLLLQAREEAEAFSAARTGIQQQLAQENHPPQTAFHVGATLRLGLRLAHAHLQWCEEELAGLQAVFPQAARKARPPRRQ